MISNPVQIASFIVISLLIISCQKAADQEPTVPQKNDCSNVKNVYEARKRFQVDRLQLQPLNDNCEKPKELTQNELPPWKPIKLESSNFDALHYKLSVTLPPSCLQSPEFYGDLEITFRPEYDNFQFLDLDSHNLNISEITLLNENVNLNFIILKDLLRIDLGKAYAKTDTLTVKIKYLWKAESKLGMFFRSREGRQDIDTIYTNSEPDYSKYWFPSNSYPNDRATFESVIEIPKPFVAVSNGVLLSVKENDVSRVYHWRQKIPVVSYLYVITAGKYSKSSTSWKNIPVEYYGPSDDIERVAYSLRDTPNMIEFFSNKIGVNYPYEKYAQTVVPKYEWGGMEHVTASTLADQTVHGPNEDDQFSSNGLVAHELAHQWFGDLLTCKSWDHLWLNEGFATYYEIMYGEKTKGRSSLYKNLESVSAWYISEEDMDPKPVVFPYYRKSLDDFFGGHVYGKGAYVLHMLRTLLGDKVFDKSIHYYMQKNQLQLVRTEDLQQAFEKVSGKNMKWFFDQWLHRPGYPKFEVTYNFLNDTKELEIKVSQKQDLTLPGGVAGLIPLFKGPIAIEYDGIRKTLELKGPQAATPGVETFLIKMDTQPEYLKFNSEMGWLARVSTKQSLSAWLSQLNKSSDPTAKVEAAQTLADKFETAEKNNENLMSFQESSLSIENCATNEKDEWVKDVCIATLSRILNVLTTTKKSAEQISNWKEKLSKQHLALAKSPRWQDRELAIAGIKAVSSDKVQPLLREIITNDPKIKVKAAAAAALGNFTKKENYDFLTSQLGRESHLDLLGSSILSALISFNENDTFSIAESYYTNKYSMAMRIAAMNLMASIGKAKNEFSEKARLNIESNLDDEYIAIRYSAIFSLAILGNKAAIKKLSDTAKNDVYPAIRSAAQDTIISLEKLP